MRRNNPDPPVLGSRLSETSGSSTGRGCPRRHFFSEPRQAWFPVTAPLVTQLLPPDEIARGLRARTREFQRDAAMQERVSSAGTPFASMTSCRRTLRLAWRCSAGSGTALQKGAKNQVTPKGARSCKEQAHYRDKKAPLQAVAIYHTVYRHTITRGKAAQAWQDGVVCYFEVEFEEYCPSEG